MAHHHLQATPQSVAWGYWDAQRPPMLHVASGDRVTIDTLSGEPEDLPADASLVMPEHRAVLAGTQRGSGPHLLTGALFSAGDGHAAQGDGEVCLTAIETSLTGTFELIVRKDLKLSMPRAETATHLIAMGMHEDLDDAARQALRQMIAWIVELTGLPDVDAYSLCSIAADLRVTQLVDINKGVHCMLPKTALAFDWPKAQSTPPGAH